MRAVRAEKEGVTEEEAEVVIEVVMAIWEAC